MPARLWRHKLSSSLNTWRQGSFPSTIVLMDGKAGKTSKSDGTNVFQLLWKAYRTLLAHSDASKMRINLCDSDFRVLEALFHEGPQLVLGTGDLLTSS